jgi:NADH/F420H2 dehydrogenase subunit C
MSAKKPGKNSAKEKSGVAEKIVAKKTIDKIEEHGLGKVVRVESGNLLEVANGLKGEGFDLFLFVSGVDYPGEIGLTYRLTATCKDCSNAVFIKTKVSKDEPVIDSLISIWPNAAWHERETYDLFGVEFRGHPNLRRMFMPDNWEGHPLRKDYSDDHMIVFPEYLKDQEKKAAAAEKSKLKAKDKTADSVDAAESKDAQEKAQDE